MEEIKLVKNSRYPFKRAGASFINTQENTFILLGGGNRSEEFEDLWELKLVNTENEKSQQAQWNKIQLKNSQYTKRTGQSAVVLDNKLYSFGGQNFHINKHFDDFLVCNLQNEEKNLEKVIKENTFGPKSILHQPGERNSSAMACDYNSKIIYIHGGADPSEPLSDLYSFEIDSQTWKKMNPEGSDQIKPVEMHTLHYYESQKDITRVNAEKNKKKKQKKKDKKKNNDTKLIDLGLGGGPQQQQQSQISGNPEDTPEQIAKNITKINLEFDPSTVVQDDKDEQYDEQAMEQIQKFEKTEQQIQEFKKQEENKNEDEEEKDENQKDDDEEEIVKKYLVLTGGRFKEEILNTIYVLDINLNQWIKLKELPHPICAHSSVIIQEKNELWIFGGTDGQLFLDTLIIYNFSNGKLYQADLSAEANLSSKKIFFGPKMAPSMAVDQISKKVLIYGGSMYEDESSQLLSIDYTKINSQLRVKKI